MGIRRDGRGVDPATRRCAALGAVAAPAGPGGRRELPGRAAGPAADRPRAHCSPLYDFARFVDDVGDAALRGRRPPATAPTGWPCSTTSTPTSTPPPRCSRPVAASRRCCRRGIRLQPFHDLVEANRVDQTVHRYATFDDLLDYCRLSAAPVGRLVLHVAGAGDAARTRLIRRRLRRAAGARALPGRRRGRPGRAGLPARGRPAAPRRRCRRAATSGAAAPSCAAGRARCELLRPGRWCASLLGLGPGRGGRLRRRRARHRRRAARARDFDVLARPVTPEPGAARACARRPAAGRAG